MSHTFLCSFNSAKAQNCDYQGGQNDDWIFDKRCAPVTVQRTVTFRGVNDGGTGNVSIYFDWGDGSTPDIVPATEISSNNWQADASHIYPIGGDNCNYEAQAYLMVNGVLCTSSVQTQIATVWDIDNQNGGIIDISPEIYPICVGNDGSVQFADISQWNCTPPDEEDTPNFRNRWTQWVYGTDTTNISTATVDGINYPWPYYGPINYYAGDTVLSPAPPASLSETIYIPPGYNVGDRFIVTIRNWNACNPYDDPSIPGPPSDPVNGDHPPVVTTAMAIIVDLPDNTISAAGPFCETDLPTQLIAATPGGTWSGPGIDPETGIFNPTEAGAGNHNIEYNVTNSNGCSVTGSINLEVKESPVVNIAPGTEVFLCPGLDLQLFAEISGGTPPYTINWSGDTLPLNNTNTVNPTFYTTNIGTYHLTALVTDDTGCSNQTDITIEVEDVFINFDPNPIALCAGETMVLSPIISGGSRNFITHIWSGPNVDKLSATDIANPVFFSTDTGTFQFNYQVVDSMGCSDQTNLTVIVKEKPFAYAGVDTLTCSLQYQLHGNVNNADSSHWSVISGPGNIFFDDQNLGTATISADQPGTYLLVWELRKGNCLDTDTVEITFSEAPTPTIIGPFQLCGLIAELETFPGINAGTWSLTSGPGEASFSNINNPQTQVEVSTPGIYTFSRLEVSPDGCIGETTQTIEFLPQAIADMGSVDAENCSPIEITFENHSINADTYQWNFGDGSASSEELPTHIYAVSGTEPDTLTIELQALNLHGCNDTISKQIIIKPVPVASFDADPLAGCSPLEVSFTNNSAGADIFYWNFGDSSSIETGFSPSHTFVNAENYVQSYQVNLTAENSYGCTNSHSVYITVYPGLCIRIIKRWT
ncbi:PKD domain-containing protein [Thermophagus xiamenensis]|uniref:PKD domain-containing protein n=2 Tax=Thermophagus xiamenensis TaxID=385682 RepID=UPI0020C8D1A7|nr:PKD domain-containing protein [Thermophagus xiamenensis]